MKRKQHRKVIPPLYCTILFSFAAACVLFIVMLWSSIQITQRNMNNNGSIYTDVISILHIGNNRSRVDSRTRNTIELKYQECAAWNYDPAWRNAIVWPELCSSSMSSGLNRDKFMLAEQKHQLSLLIETILPVLRNTSRTIDVSPTCGSYCIFHPSSLYSHQYDIPIFGWELRTLKPKPSDNHGTPAKTSTGCWQPFNSRTNDIDLECIEYSYNRWLSRIEDMLPKEQTEGPHLGGRITSTLYPQFFPNHSVTNSLKLPLYRQAHRNDDDKMWVVQNSLT